MPQPLPVIPGITGILSQISPLRGRTNYPIFFDSQPRPKRAFREVVAAAQEVVAPTSDKP